MKNIILGILLFAAIDVIETTDLTLTTDDSNTGTQQRIYLVKADGKSLIDDLMEDLCE
jgi:hypothetical protein